MQNGASRRDRWRNVQNLLVTSQCKFSQRVLPEV